MTIKGNNFFMRVWFLQIDEKTGYKFIALICDYDFFTNKNRLPLL
jgi:hypothetical protein